MAALDFPANPINGQTYALNGVTYYYNSSMGAWLTQLTSMNIASSSNTQVLFNDAGIANGSSGLVFDKVANTVTVNALNTVGSLGVGTNNPLIKLDVNGGMRVQSLSNPASGSGMELGYDSTQGVIQAFTNRATLATAPIYFTGGQIKFPATQNASSDANTLDDYEEGTWSPTITQSTSNPTGITYNRQQGIYIKVGTLVYLSFNLYITAITNGSGFIRISNFPFTAANSSEGDRAGMTINYCSGFTSTSCPTGGIVLNGQNAIDLTTSNSSDARDGRSTYCTNTGTSINLYGTIMYRASA